MNAVQLITMAAFIGAVLSSQPVSAQIDSYGGPPIEYMTTEVNDPVAKLSKKLKSGQLKLDHDGKLGYLKSVLKELDIPISSQTLVFSKTSMQLHRISPRKPRAIYFSDDVYVGYCQQGEVLELAATDTKQGATFYTIKQTDEQPAAVIRDRGLCLSCHSTNRTQNVPGYFVRSVYADFTGRPALGEGTFTTDHSSPFKERWGGWYVTGKHGEMSHMGNVLFRDGKTFDYKIGANRESLAGVVSTDPYLSPHSDLVALMVLEHQTQMHNAIAWANYETRRALYQSNQMNELLDREPGTISESANRRINRAAENVLEYLLFHDEFVLQSPVSGSSNFQADFESRGERDQRERSLRDMELQTRLFRYPCSYLIYSPAFDGLPDEVRTRVLDRLADVLDGEEVPEFTHLSPQMRREIAEILRDTKPEFAKVAAQKAASS
ncbi:MAG: hypothetical protein AB8B91_16965 [Rubripirellula sp.]